MDNPEIGRLAAQHVRLLRRQLLGTSASEDDALVERVETLLRSAARSCEDVSGLELAYDALTSVPTLRLRDGRCIELLASDRFDFAEQCDAGSVGQKMMM